MKCLLPFLSVLFLLFFAGCVTNSGNRSGQTEPGVAARVRESGVLRLGTTGDYVPLNFTNAEGALVGLEIDVARYLALSLGVRLQIVDLPFAELMPAVADGRVDLAMSGITITPRRNVDVAFVGPYMLSGKSFVAKAAFMEDLERHKAENFAGVTVGVVRGTTSQEVVHALATQATIIVTDKFSDLARKVDSGEVDAIMADYPYCVMIYNAYKDRGYLMPGTLLTIEPLGIALPASDPHWGNLVENYLNQMEMAGEMDDLKSKWLGRVLEKFALDHLGLEMKESGRVPGLEI